jgi:23S rRNA G2069 N7-methylase RlmK/C1962 C5-methylase RlmI
VTRTSSQPDQQTPKITIQIPAWYVVTQEEAQAVARIKIESEQETAREVLPNTKAVLGKNLKRSKKFQKLLLPLKSKVPEGSHLKTT